MKIILQTLFIIGVSLNYLTYSYAIDSTYLKVKGGELEIIGEPYEMKIMFNDKRLPSGDGYNFSIKNKFSLADSDIVLIEVALGGNACGTLYYFVTISHRGAAKITDEIGACEEEPKLKFNGSELTIKFSNKTYIYSNGKFTENGKPYKKF